MDKQQQLQELERVIQAVSEVLQEHGTLGRNIAQEAVYDCGLFLRAIAEYPAAPQFWQERAQRASNSLAALRRAIERERVRRRLRE